MTEGGKVKNITESALNRMSDECKKISARGMRCLAIGFKKNLKTLNDYDGKDHPGHKLISKPENFAKLEEDITLLGFVGIKDPPRDSVKVSIE
jgi:magnesium-transporting ATPase (P-type)